MRTAQSSVVDVESLRELEALLRANQRTSFDPAIQAQHRYLLHAGGANAGVLEPTEIHSTDVVLLFCLPNPKLNWQELSPETQEKVMRLLALFLRQQGTIVSAAPVAGEGADE